MLLAQKAFSNYDCYPFFEPYLAGTEASGLFEARLGAEEMPEKEVHIFCAGYPERGQRGNCHRENSAAVCRIYGFLDGL